MLIVNQSTLTFEERERWAFVANDPQQPLLAELAHREDLACDIELAAFVRENMGSLLNGLRALQNDYSEGDDEHYVELDQLSADLQSLGEAAK